MSRRRVAAAALLVLAGVGVLGSPWVRGWYYDGMQQQAIRAWREAMADGAPAVADKEADPSLGGESAILGDDIWLEGAGRRWDSEYLRDNMVGILTIEAISLTSPILTSATAHHLDLAVCWVSGTGEIGAVGNYVLAGHNSRTYGRHFNRLCELVPGDLVLVEGGGTVFPYCVTEVFRVEAAETWVMEAEGDRRIITLITCDYSTEPMGRLVVRGERIKGD